MSSKKIFVGDIGVTFKVFSNIDLTSATSIVFDVKKPSGIVASWTASLDPTNSYYGVYTSSTNDLNESGIYLLSLQCTFAGGIIHTGESAEFEVFSQFEDTQEC